MSVRSVRAAMFYRRKKRGMACAQKKRTFKLNEVPITQTTEMMICRYHFEGMEISEIMELTSRPEKLIKETVRNCKENGKYNFFNQYGTSVVFNY